MYVKREVRPGARRGPRLVFALVRSERTGPRVRTIRVAYLGTLPQASLRFPLRRRALWTTADAALAQLSLESPDLEHVRAQLAAYVPPPSAEEIATAEAGRAAWAAQLRSMVGYRR